MFRRCRVWILQKAVAARNTVASRPSDALAEKARLFLPSNVKRSIEQRIQEFQTLYYWDIPGAREPAFYHPLKPFGKNSSNGDNVENENDDKATSSKLKAFEISKALDAMIFAGTDRNYRSISRREEERANAASVKLLVKRLTKMIQSSSSLGPSTTLSLYGSYRSGTHLGKQSDVDLSLSYDDLVVKKIELERGFIRPRAYEKFLKQTVYRIVNELRNFNGNQFRQVHGIPWAKRPVIKGTMIKVENPYTRDGSRTFDICLMNELAIANSLLIREYTLVDPRVQPLILAVKLWAHDNHIISTEMNPNNLSSYCWTLQVIFYLQCIGCVPNLQSREIMKKVNFQRNVDRHTIDNLDTAFVKWEQIKQTNGAAWQPAAETESLPITALLYGFFHFYANSLWENDPDRRRVLSIKQGPDVFLPKTVFGKKLLSSSELLLYHNSFCTEDPFETYDSKQPRYLWFALNDYSCARIETCLQNSAKYLADVLSGKTKAMVQSKLEPTRNDGHNGMVVNGNGGIINGTTGRNRNGEYYDDEERQEKQQKETIDWLTRVKVLWPQPTEYPANVVEKKVQLRVWKQTREEARKEETSVKDHAFPPFLAQWMKQQRKTFEKQQQQASPRNHTGDTKSPDNDKIISWVRKHSQ